MLSKSNRLPAFAISPLMRTGKRIQGNGFMIAYRRQEPVSRFAFVVGTSVDKRAVVRNRIKRCLRESVQHLLPQIVPAIDGVMVGRKELIGLSQQDVEARVRDALMQAGLLS